MFTLKAFINEREIARIDVQNMGLHPKHKKCEYKLRRVNGKEYGSSSILHKQSKGWMALAVKVLEHLIEDEGSDAEFPFGWSK